MKIRTVGTIGWFEMTRYLKDKIALFTTVVMPVILVLVIGVSFGAAPAGFTVGVLDADNSATSEGFIDRLASGDVTVTRYTSASDLARDIRLGFLAAGITVERGFEDVLQAQAGTTTLTLSLDQTSTNAAALATVVSAAAADFTEQQAAVRVAVAAVPAAPAEAAAAAGPISSQIAADTADVTTRQHILGTVRESDRNGFATAVPTQLTLFVFLNGLLAGMTIVESRRSGVSRRILATPTGVGPHILGIGLGRWLLGLIQAALLLAIGALMFGVNFGHWPTITALVLVWTALSAAVGMLIGAVAKTPDQVVAVSVPLGIGLGLLGGSMWPLSVVPSVMRTLAHITPHAWANDAWLSIVDEGATMPAIAAELAVLVAMTIAVAALAVVLLRRALSQ